MRLAHQHHRRTDQQFADEHACTVRKSLIVSSPLVATTQSWVGTNHPGHAYRRSHDRRRTRHRNTRRPAGGVHRGWRDGRRRDLRPARRGWRGGGCRCLAVVPARRRGRRPAGLLVRQVRCPVPVGRWPARVRRAWVRRRPRHRSHRLVDPGRQRHRHGHGRSVVRQLCRLGGCGWRGGVGQGLRGAGGSGDDDAQRRRITSGRPDPDGRRCRRDRHPHRVRRGDTRQHGPGSAGLLRLPAVRRHRGQRGADVLRLFGFRSCHVHGQGPRRPGPPAATRPVPRPGDRHRRVRRGRSGSVRHALGRRGHRVRRNGARRGRRADARSRRLLDDERHRVVCHGRGHQRRSLSGYRALQPDGFDRTVPPGDGATGRVAGPAPVWWSRRRLPSCSLWGSTCRRSRPSAA